MGDISNMHTKLWSVSLSGTDLLEDQGMILLKRICKKYNCRF